MITRKEILELAEKGEKISAGYLRELGHNRSQFHPHLMSLVADGLLFKYGESNNTYYTTEPPAPKDPARSRKFKAPLPDLPPLMLNWLGYTDKVPDPDAGEFIHGGKW